MVKIFLPCDCRQIYICGSFYVKVQRGKNVHKGREMRENEKGRQRKRLKTIGSKRCNIHFCKWRGGWGEKR
jgi:hypothetical protein